MAATSQALALAALVTLVGACAPGASAPTAPTGPLCDALGDPSSVRLLYRIGGGGQVLPGSQVVSENGFEYLAVMGDCTYHAYVGARRTGRWGEVVTGRLAPQGVADLDAELRLSDWESIAGDHYLPSCDASSIEYTYEDDRVRLLPSCHGERDSASQLDWLRAAVRAALDRLVAAGTPTTGAVRYVVVRDETSVPDALEYRNAPPWPLARPIGGVAVSEAAAGDYRPGASHRADGADAAAMRAIRAAFLRGEIGFADAAYLPVVDAGARFRLFIRDASVLEGDDGLLRLP